MCSDVGPDRSISSIHFGHRAFDPGLLGLQAPITRDSTLAFSPLTKLSYMRGRPHDTLCSLTLFYMQSTTPLIPLPPLSAHYPRSSLFIFLTIEVTMPLLFSNSSESVRTIVTQETSNVQHWLTRIKIEPELIMGLGVRWCYAFDKKRVFGVATL